jgi:hypothetical protein
MRPRLLVLAIALSLAGCRRADEPPLAAAPGGLACPTAPATGVSTTLERGVDCTSLVLCRRGCRGGDAHACYVLGRSLEQDAATEAEASVAFHRSCELGHAGGCTNYAAKLWAGDTDLACAGALFQRTCDAGEGFGCGMVARLVLEADPPPDDAARAATRAHLEASCERVSGFACRVLAQHLERGTFGAHDPTEIPRLLARACAGGDRDGCGNPPTAASTFD